MEITPQPLTSDAFAPFGDVIDMPTEPGRTYYEDALGNLRADAHGQPVVALKAPTPDRPLSADLLERHEFSSQTFVPVDVGRWLIVVAPHAAAGGPDIAGARLHRRPAARASPTSANTWHHGLTVLDRPGRFAVFMWRDGSTGDEEFVPVAPFTITFPDLERRAWPIRSRRDFVGYGANPPDPKWPNGARLAVNFVHELRGGLRALHRRTARATPTPASPTRTAWARRSRAATSPPKACSSTAAGSASGASPAVPRARPADDDLRLRPRASSAIPRPPRRSGRPATTSARTAGAGSSTTSSPRPRSASTSARRSTRPRR